MKLKIGLDIDEVIAGWYPEYCKLFGANNSQEKITKDVLKLRYNKTFWENLPVLHRPDFIPELYCTKRINSKEYTKNFLKKNDLPLVPIYQIYYQYSSKASKIKGKVDLFIDDSLYNFIDLNLKGIPCLLMDSPLNKGWGPIARIHSLNIDEIMDCYYLFIETMFYNFKNLVHDRCK